MNLQAIAQCPLLPQIVFQSDHLKDSRARPSPAGQEYPGAAYWLIGCPS